MKIHPIMADLYGRHVKANARPIIALGLKLYGAVASFALTLLVARSAGPEVTGEFALAMSTVALGTLVAVAGLDQLLVRAIGGDLRQGKAGRANVALRATARTVARSSVAVALFVFAFAPFAEVIDVAPRTMMLAAGAVLAMPLMRIALSALRASGDFVISQSLDGPVHSTLLCLAVGILLLVGSRPGAQMLTLGYGLCLALSAGLGWWILYRRTSGWPVDDERQSFPWLKGWPLLVTGGGHVLTSWLLMAQVGASLGAAEAGAYRVAVQIINIIYMMLTTIETLVNPQFAGDFRMGDYEGAWRRHRRATLFMILCAAPGILICLLIPSQVLGIFGPGFEAASVALTVMVGGQVVNVATGPIGGMMVMSGRERILLYLSVTGLLIAVVLSVVLVPLLGLVGAAIASIAATIFRNIFCYVYMHVTSRRRAVAGSEA